MQHFIKLFTSTLCRSFSACTTRIWSTRIICTTLEGLPRRFTSCSGEWWIHFLWWVEYILIYTGIGVHRNMSVLRSRGGVVISDPFGSQMVPALISHLDRKFLDRPALKSTQPPKNEHLGFSKKNRQWEPGAGIPTSELCWHTYLRCCSGLVCRATEHSDSQIYLEIYFIILRYT